MVRQGRFQVVTEDRAIGVEMRPSLQKRLRKGGKNTKKNYTKKIFMTQIITMV